MSEPFWAQRRDSLDAVSATTEVVNLDPVVVMRVPAVGHFLPSNLGIQKASLILARS